MCSFVGLVDRTSGLGWVGGWVGEGICGANPFNIRDASADAQRNADAGEEALLKGGKQARSE
jgi:hypothetical protein